MIRGIVQSVIEGMVKRITCSGRSDETITNREYFQHYGFSSRPLAGAEAILIQEGNHIVMLASDDRRYRIGIEAGEVCLYTDEGDHIRFKRGKEIYIKSGNKLTAEIENEVNVTTKAAKLTCETAEVIASTSAELTSPEVTITASTQITLTSPLVQINGRIGMTGGMNAGDDIVTSADVIDGVRSMAADRLIYDGHTHNDPQGGTVAAPNEKETP
jgi:phage baseplate assembly protein V